MKVYKNGKEVKNPTIHFNIMGKPSAVTIDGKRYNARAFEFKNEEPQKKTRTTKETAKRTKKN